MKPYPSGMPDEAAPLALGDVYPGLRPAFVSSVHALRPPGEAEPIIAVVLVPSEGYGATPLVRAMGIDDAVAFLNEMGQTIEAACQIRDERST